MYIMRTKNENLVTTRYRSGRKPSNGFRCDRDFLQLTQTSGSSVQRYTA